MGGIEKRVGYIVTRKIGSAVVRNRVKRRLKEATRLLFKDYALGGQDYLFIARENALRQDFSALMKEFMWALKHVQRLISERQE